MRDNYGYTYEQAPDTQPGDGPTLSIADDQSSCSVSWHWHLHGSPPGQAEEYRRANAVLLDLGAEPLWAQLAWAALRYEDQRSTVSNQTSSLREKASSQAQLQEYEKKYNPYLDRCAEVLTALRGPPDAEGWTILFEPAPAGGVKARLLGCKPDEDELEREISDILAEFSDALR